jgi:hypothetical protein
MVMEIAQLLLIVALLAYVIGRRLTGQPYTTGRLLTVPAIMVGYGLFELTKVHVGPGAVAVLAVEAVVGLAFGVLRGLTIRLYERDGYLWYRYTPWTIALWIAAIAARIGVTVAAHAMGANLPTATLVAALGVSLLGEAAVVLPRARRTGVPMATDRRTARARAGVR